MSERVSNTNCDEYVERRKEFKGSNLFGEWKEIRSTGEQMYVVYSYGYHWPLYVYADSIGRWFSNRGKYSSSSSKHSSQAGRRINNEIPLDSREISAMVNCGYEGLREMRNKHYRMQNGNQTGEGEKRAGV